MIGRIRLFVLGACLAASGLAQAQPEAFAAARARGELVVGVPYLAPPPAAGAKIRTPDGRLRFVTDTRYVVLTQGARAEADIVMVAAR